MTRKELISMFACVAAAVCAPASSAQQPEMTAGMASQMMMNWPEASRKAAMDMMQKYGMPDQATPHMMIWHANGPWKWTTVSSMEIQHNFPVPHPDVLEQAINYDVPIDRYDDLTAYDGSVMAERTKGEMSARCDTEGANFLAMNLAHDVASGRRSVQDARTYYANAIAAYKRDGRMDPYMQRLAFTPPETAGDPDRAVL